MEWKDCHEFIEQWLDQGCPEMKTPGQAGKLAMCIGAIVLDHKKKIAEEADAQA